MDRTSLLNTSAYMNKLTYKISSDTTFHPGDTLRLSLQGTFVSVDTVVPSYAYISLSAYYADSISTADTILNENGRIELSINLDKEKKFTSISGSVNYLDSTDNRNSLLILSGMELMRYHVRLAADTVSLRDSTATAAEL